MTLYGTALFIHVVFAILLVGGSAFAHVTTSLIKRARTVDGIRAHVAWLSAFVKASGPISGVVLLAGLYLAFDGSWWGRGWPIVALVLFAGAGASAMGIIDPKVEAIRERLEQTLDGPVTPELGASLADRTLTTVTWVLGGVDLALVFLMTNKPGWTGSIVVAVLGIALGYVMAMRELRHPAPEPAAPAMPA